MADADDEGAPPSLSAQQSEAIANVLAGKHTVVTACPGAGKSTVFREGLRTIAMSDPFAAVAIISYNRALKNETETKVTKMEFPETFQVDTFTSHGLLGQMFSAVIPDDLSAYQLLRSSKSASTAPADYSFVFVDEAQDMSTLTKMIINHLISRLPAPPVMFVVGDLRQQLYGEMNMDLTGSIALRTPSEVFDVPGEWCHVNFNRSFRLSPKSADWLSTAFRLVGPERIVGANTRSANVDVSYEQELPGKETQDRALDAILELLRTYAPGQILIAALSVDHSGELRNVVNALYKSNIPVYVSDYLRGTSSGDEAEGKILVTTCHQAKGLEREAALVLLKRSPGRVEGEFDPAWFVGMSRHTEAMIVIDNRNRPFFLMRGGHPVLPAPKPPHPPGYRMSAYPNLSESKATRFTKIGVVLNLFERMAPRIKVTKIPWEGDDPVETLEMPSNPAIRENIGRYYRAAIHALAEITMFPDSPPLIAREYANTVSKFKNDVARYFPDWDGVAGRVFLGKLTATGRDAMTVAAVMDACNTGYHHLVSRLAKHGPNHWVTADMERYIETMAERLVAGVCALGVGVIQAAPDARIAPGDYYDTFLRSSPSLKTLTHAALNHAVIDVELSPREDDTIKFQQKDLDLLVRMYILGCTKAHIVLCATHEVVTFQMDAETIEGYVHSILESKFCPR